MTLIEPLPIPARDELGHLHFIAIGGAGMSGVAAAYLESGHVVSGCDQAGSVVLDELASRGARVFTGHDPAHLDGVDTVVVSTAIRAGNPELAEARRRGLPVLHRSLALAALMRDRSVVSVAGTHGKTTTTAMCVAGLTAAGADPGFVIGAALPGSGIGARAGSGDWFVAEADESDGSFLQYPTTVAVITGVESDHLDNWGTADAYAAGFGRFAAAPGVATVIHSADDPTSARLGAALAGSGRRVVSFGRSPHADVRILEPELFAGGSRARLAAGDWSADLRLAVPGLHNLSNAAAAVCVAEALRVPRDAFLRGLAAFQGTARRFQTVGEARGVTVIDDYAHHPTEVAATIAAARSVVGSGRVIVCFQPHLFTRTRDFAPQFGEALAAADAVVVLDIYPAREDPIPGVTGELVARAVAEAGGRVRYVPRLEDAVPALVGLAGPGDLILTVGAGSVTTLGAGLLAGLEA